MNRIGITVALAIALAGCAHKLPPPVTATHHQAPRKVAPDPVKPAVVAPIPAPAQATPAVAAPEPKPSFRQRVLNSLVRQRAVK